MKEALRLNTGEASSARSLLDTVSSPADIRGMDEAGLCALADELRRETISIVSKTGGHLGASLGVVELTLALHAVFNTPEDRLIWDVGHQSYPHKIITGRRDAMSTLRQGGGLSGFTRKDESEYDPFGAGHSSTSISAGLGMAAVRDIAGKDNDVICVIGDGAMSGGMAFEAMNNAGELGSRLIVVLNDNRMSISPPVGAMSRYLTKLVSSSPYIGARDIARNVTDHLPSPLRVAARRAEETARAALGGGTLFEEMGFYYIGPVDGHNIGHLLSVLKNVKDAPRKGPILVHCHTVKGKGYAPAENSRDKMHGVSRFDVVTGAQRKPGQGAPSYTKVFAQTLTACAGKDDRIIGVTAAMPEGTGMDVFARAFPERMFDVGIAEQHAVTFAAGMAAEGFRPFVALYSTFLQRGFDQMVHDVAIQKLPVRFAIDRAGLVGEDGRTHAGAFDTAFMSCIPGMVLMAASEEAELARMVRTAAVYDEGPIAFRYPRGAGWGGLLPECDEEILEIGKGRIVREGTDVAIISYGARLGECLKAADLLERRGVTASVADARFAKPLDGELLERLARSHSRLVTVEEGAKGGFGSAALHFLNDEGLLGSGLKVRTLFLPDEFQPHDTQDRQYELAGLDASRIAGECVD